jgi:tRNA(Ile)-lysidine synthase
MNDLSQHIQKNWAFLSGKKIFLACSGGIDSMTLLALFHACKLDMEVLHVNYQLRGLASEKDQQLVEKVCQQLEIPFHLKRIKLQDHLEKKGGNLQEEARKLRYDFFDQKCALNPTSVLALGHHLDDQIETFFMHIARKSGIMGMACMLEQHQQIIRPLLPFSKEVIRSYALHNKVIWREDESNNTNKYARNLLRNVILPDLLQHSPNLKQSIPLLIQKFQETQLELEHTIFPILGAIKKSQELPFVRYDDFSTEEKIELLRQLGIKTSILRALEKLRNSQKGKKIPLKSATKQTIFVEIIRESHSFHFIKPPCEQEKPPALSIEPVEKLPTIFQSDELYLDAAKIKGELFLRRWKKGDRMKIIGMAGSKLISDILKDAKIPSHLRKNYTVVSDREKVIWCVGLRIDSSAVATRYSKNILKISVVQG